MDNRAKRAHRVVGEETSSAPLATNFVASFKAVENYSREREYQGYCKFDALNSPLLEALSGKSALLRLVFTQLVNRVPLPLREGLGVKKFRNPKGIANFVRAYAATIEGKPVSESMVRMESLAQWLLKNDSQSKGAYSGPGKAWGYQFPWQSPGFYLERHAPNCIVTTFVGEALLECYRVTQKQEYLSGAIAASKFLTQALPILEEDKGRLCIGYVETGLKWKVININAVSAGFLVKLGKATSDQGLIDRSRRMIQWVMEARREDGKSWDYTLPLSQSGIGPDNYHTGGILDGIHDYLVHSGDHRHQAVFMECAAFYASGFFEGDGAPRWRLNRSYPQDIHGAAQGILTFSKISRWEPTYLGLAKKIAGWAVTHMQGSEGQFYYQRRRFYTWKTPFMRWNNSWMMWALAQLNREEGRSIYAS